MLFEICGNISNASGWQTIRFDEYRVKYDRVFIGKPRRALIIAHRTQEASRPTTGADLLNGSCCFKQPVLSLWKWIEMKISANIANNLEIIPFFIFIFRYIEIS